MTNPTQDDLYQQWLADLAASEGSEAHSTGIFSWRRSRRREAAEAGAADAEMAEAVMRRLPEGRPDDYRRMAVEVLEAWTDEARREALRSAPSSFLADRGVALPSSARVEIVALAEARLPTPELVTIPLPGAEAPAMSRREAETALYETDWAWLLDAPWLEEDVEEMADAVETAPAPAPSSTRRPRRSWRVPAPAMAAFALGALALAFGLGSLLSGGEGGLSGTAGEGGLPGSALSWILVVAVLAGLGIWAWRSGR